MRTPPQPHVAFTIPSLHDDTTLDCRLYDPDILLRAQPPSDTSETPWRKRGIVMAHPYAPMGGSYDDRVVGVVVEEFLALGYVVATFNFRGASRSQGRTSWSGKPEVSDYISVAGFFIHYLSHIQPDSVAGLGPTPQNPAHDEEPPVLVLGGYSHGSLILQHLPPVSTIIQLFSVPAVGSAAHEIILRARRVADESNAEWLEMAVASERHDHQRNYLSVTMGGEETSPGQRRRSREMRRSVDLGHPFRNLHWHHKPSRNPNSTAEAEAEANPDLDSTSGATNSSTSQSSVRVPQVRYLLISPLTGPVSLLAAPGLGHRFWPRHTENQDVIAEHQCLVLYGDQDIFSSAAKVRAWVERLRCHEGDRVRGVEVIGAGHFWHELGVEGRLRDELRGWAAEAV